MRGASGWDGTLIKRSPLIRGSLIDAAAPSFRVDDHLQRQITKSAVRDRERWMSFKPAERVDSISQEEEPHVQAVWLAHFLSGTETKQRSTM